MEKEEPANFAIFEGDLLLLLLRLQNKPANKRY
jgi:hypothetical protein